jgi:hypothetical protein
MRILKQSTTANVMVFLTSSSDHITGATGLTLTITASKDGGAFGSITPTVTERGSGWYSLALTSSHTDTRNDLALHLTATGADPADLVCRVGPVDANVVEVGGVAATPDPTTPVTLAAGTVATGTSTTSFTATISGSTLSSTTGAYDGMRLLFQSGALAGEAGVISTYVVASGTATFTFAAGQAFTATPAAGVTFIIG